jgi:hypothetical protein
MATQPGRSIPQLFATPYEVKAAYNLFRHAEATPDTLQASHREEVKAEMHEPGVYLFIEDTTTLSWSGKQAIPGLGPIGRGTEGLQGFQLHAIPFTNKPRLSFEVVLPLWRHKGPHPRSGSQPSP